MRLCLLEFYRIERIRSKDQFFGKAKAYLRWFNYQRMNHYKKGIPIQLLSDLIGNQYRREIFDLDPVLLDNCTHRCTGYNVPVKRRNIIENICESGELALYLRVMFKRPSFPEGIDKVLTRTLKGLKIDRRIKEETALLNWNKVVGDRIASYAKPLRVRDSILFVRVQNASWRNELVFLKAKIIKELNHSVKANVLKDIVFTN